MSNNVDCRELLIIEKTTLNIDLVEQNANLQKLIKTILVTGVVVSTTAIIISIYIQNNKEKDE
jgi:hypothetical protein